MTDNVCVAIDAPPMPYVLECGKAVYAPGDQHPNRNRLGVFDLLLVVKGTLYIGEEVRRWSVSEGQLLMLLPDRYHYSVMPCETETAFYWIHFQAPGKWEAAPLHTAAPQPETSQRDMLSTSPSRDIALPQYAAPSDFPDIIRLAEQLLVASAGSRFSSFWEKHRLFGELLERLDEGRRPEHVSAAKRLAEQTEAYLKRHYQNPVTNETLAEALHFHPGYIVRCMRTYYRCTPMEYLHMYRLEQAKLLLLKTDWPIGKIAEHTGFSNAAYFSSRFIKAVGSPPLLYRKRFSK